MAGAIKGEVGILYIHDGTIYRPIACLTSNSLETAVSVIESNTKCNPGVTMKQAGTFSYSIKADGEYIDTTSVGGQITKASHDYLLQKQLIMLPITWKLITGVVGADYYGTAIITDLGLPQGAGDEISTFSVTFNGIGIISSVDPIV